MDLQLVHDFIEQSNSSNSNNDKLEVLKTYTQYEIVRQTLHYTYNTFKQYGVTSQNCKKNSKLVKYGYTDLFKLLDDLNDRYLTGHEAISYVNGFIDANKSYEDIIWNVIDRNLKTRSTTSMINKVYPGLIPTFDVALANAYNEKTAKKIHWSDGWYVSRKLDGVRCLVMIDENGEAKFFSRSGKEFTTLGNLKTAIHKLGLKNTVLDGEVCIVDENGDEDFQGIIKEIKRKDHTIQNPYYYIFDQLTMEEFIDKTSIRTFKQRLDSLTVKLNDVDSQYFSVLPQYRSDDKVFEEMIKQSKEGDWEGLMLRKDAPYQGKRSNDILKVKSFHDAEYIVVDVENSVNRVIVEGLEVEEEMLKNVVIEHKGHRVQVGSGFSLQQKRHYYKHPEEILGKQITVQYFEESRDQTGGYSLRFPVVKAIYNQRRDF